MAGVAAGAQVGQRPQAGVPRRARQGDHDRIGRPAFGHQRVHVVKPVQEQTVRRFGRQMSLPADPGGRIAGQQRHIGGHDEAGGRFRQPQRTCRSIALFQFFGVVAQAQQAADPGLQHRVVERLAEDVVGTGLERPLARRPVVLRRYRDHRNRGQCLVSA